MSGITINDPTGALSTLAKQLGVDEDTARAIITSHIQKKQRELYSYAEDAKRDKDN